MTMTSKQPLADRPGPRHPILRPLALAATVALGSLAPSAAGAQQTGWLRVNLGPGGERGSFLVTCMRDGEVVFQTESTWGSGPHCTIGGSDRIPVGVYDVRIEGAGVRTEVREGVVVTAENRSALYVVMTAGEGARVVEYASGGLSREEVAARLRALESAREETQASMADLQRRVEELEGAVEELRGRDGG